MFTGKCPDALPDTRLVSYKVRVAVSGSCDVSECVGVELPQALDLCHTVPRDVAALRMRAELG